jgi:hypothetical protein
MTDLDLYTGLPRENVDPTGGRLVAWAQAAGAAHQLATSLSRTSFVPRAFQGNAADATAAIMLGDELGLKPLASLRSIYIISGTPAMYARTMVALVMSQGHQVWTESSTDREVIVCGKRRGSDHEERAVWNIDRARKAGYTNNKKYESDPQAMLYAKAAGEVARKIAPDVLAGVPFSVEDLELEEQPTAKVSRSPSRVQRARPETPEPSFDEPEPPSAEPVQATAERVRDLVGVLGDGPVGVDPITPKQLTALNAMLTSDYDLRDRADKLAFLSAELGREIGSSKEVTRAEASKLLDSIARDMHGAEPVEPPLDGM